VTLAEADPPDPAAAQRFIAGLYVFSAQDNVQERD
jgi:hypothetical protein